MISKDCTHSFVLAVRCFGIRGAGTTIHIDAANTSAALEIPKLTSLLIKHQRLQIQSNVLPMFIEPRTGMLPVFGMGKISTRPVE